MRDTGNLLERQGYKIKVLDLNRPEKSHCYNPFVYIKDDNDVQKLVGNLFKSTTPKDSKRNIRSILGYFGIYAFISTYILLEI